VIVTSDHGEIFERGVWEHLTPLLYEPLIHIPLLISKPGAQQRQDVHTPTSCVDLLPTLMQIAGQPIPGWCEGQVLPTFGSQEEDLGRSIFSVEAKLNPGQAPLTKGTAALIKGRHKLIHYFGYEGHESVYELYDVVDDPEELQNFYASDTSLAVELQSELERKLAAENEPYVK